MLESLHNSLNFIKTKCQNQIMLKNQVLSYSEVTAKIDEIQNLSTSHEFVKAAIQKLKTLEESNTASTQWSNQTYFSNNSIIANDR